VVGNKRGGPLESANVEEERRQPLAVICGASATGLGIARDLGRRGVPICFADTKRHNPGLASKYVSTEFPQIIVSSSEELGRRLQELGRKLPAKAVLLQASDEMVLAVAEHRAELEDYYWIAGSVNTADALNFIDKKRFYETCLRIGMATPKTAFPQDVGEAHRCAGEFTFPIILKPVVGHKKGKRLRGKKLLFIRSPKEFKEAVNQFADSLEGLILQEYIPGTESNIWFAGVYSDSSARVRQCFVGRKLRQYPPGCGIASLAESARCPEVCRLTEELIERTGYRGICEPEFKYDERDGTFKIIEVNPRPMLWNALMSASGMDLNYYAYCDLAGLPLPECHKQHDGRRWLFAEKDVLTAVRYCLSGKLTPAAYFRSLRGVVVHPIVSRDDPSPMYRLLRHYAFRVLQQVGFGRTKTAEPPFSGISPDARKSESS